MRNSTFSIGREKHKQKGSENMGLRFIHGRAGTGKTTFCFEEIKKLEEKGEKIYIITPEQFSFTAEKRLLESLGKATLNAEVITFHRMANRLMEENGKLEKTVLSKKGKEMLIYSILSDEKKSLKFLGKSDENIKLVSDTITEFKKHNLTIEILEKLIKNETDEYLKLKLQDVYVIYNKFEEQLKTKFIATDDILNILIEKLEQSNLFENSHIYMDEFAGFTPQEYGVIEELLKMAKQVSITICSDNLENKEEDCLFYMNNIMAEKMEDIVKKNGIEKEKPIFLEEPFRFKTKELEHLEKNIYAFPYKKYEDDIKNIEFFLCANPYDEIEHIAKNILKQIREENIKYKDISIITKDIGEYQSIIKALFHKYEIPVFIDEKKDLSQNILVKFILSVLEILATGWAQDSVITCIKSGFFDIKMNDVYDIENFCIRWGIKGKAWYESDWAYGLDESSKEELERLNNLRRKITEPILSLKEELGKTKTAKEISTQIYNFLKDNKIEDKLNQKVQKLLELEQIDMANEYITGLDIFVEVLDQIVSIFDNQKMSFEKYKEILKIGLSGDILGKIPATLDQVIVGDVDRSRSHKVHTVYIVGVNDGAFPNTHTDEGYFSDKDREYLKNKGIELAKGSIENLYEEQFNIYKAFTTAENKLYISYCSSDKDGSAKRQSIVVLKLKKIFPKHEEKSDVTKKGVEISTKVATFDTLLEQMRKIKDEEIDIIWLNIYEEYKNDEEWSIRLKTALNGIEDTNIAEEIDEENIKKLYGKTLRTSVSKMEQYRKCPFSFHLKYGLKLKDKKEYVLNLVDTGSFMHNVIDKFFEYIDIKGLKAKQVDEDAIEKIVGTVVNEVIGLPQNYMFRSSPKFISLTNRLKKVVTGAIKYIIYQLQASDFENIGNEVEFSENSVYEPIKIELEDGHVVQVTGKIDRIDMAEEAGEKYLRIIDYKSSARNVDLNEAYAGIQIQLLTYIDAATKVESANPAGVLYFGLEDTMISLNKNMTDEEIEQKVRKKFKMNGIIIADVNIVRKMDKNLEKGYSDIVPAFIGKEGDLSISKSNAITKEDFIALQKYTTQIITKISKEILSGNIEISPYYNAKNGRTQCEYCTYRGICGFDKTKKNNKCFYIPKYEKQEVLEKIKEQKEGKI